MLHNLNAFVPKRKPDRIGSKQMFSWIHLYAQQSNQMLPKWCLSEWVCTCKMHSRLGTLKNNLHILSNMLIFASSWVIFLIAFDFVISFCIQFCNDRIEFWIFISLSIYLLAIPSLDKYALFVTLSYQFGRQNLCHCLTCAIALLVVKWTWRSWFQGALERYLMRMFFCTVRSAVCFTKDRFSHFLHCLAPNFPACWKLRSNCSSARNHSGSVESHSFLLLALSIAEKSYGQSVSILWVWLSNKKRVLCPLALYLNGLQQEARSKLYIFNHCKIHSQYIGGYRGTGWQSCHL
jgi:hypothetical protein